MKDIDVKILSHSHQYRSRTPAPFKGVQKKAAFLFCFSTFKQTHDPMKGNRTISWWSFTKNVSGVPQLPDIGVWQGTKVRTQARPLGPGGLKWTVVWPAWGGAGEGILHSCLKPVVRRAVF